jgi:surface antigen
VDNTPPETQTRKAGPVLLAGAGIVLVVLLAGGILVVSLVGALVSTVASPTAGTAGQQICRPGAGGTEGEGNVSVPEQYQQTLSQAAADTGISETLLAAQIEQESGWDPNAVSHVGARGLAQFMPATWAQYGQGADPFDPEAAIVAQARYMADLYDQVGSLAANDEDRIRFALAAYNAGPGAVLNAGGVPPYPETQRYVQTITAAAGASAGISRCSGVLVGDLNIDGVGVDDYPYREPVGAAGWSSPRSAFGHVPRQCTDFVAWRLNQAMGWTPESDERPPFSFATLGVGYGPGQRGAGSWHQILPQVSGISFHRDSAQPGDIAWWGYSDVGGGYGHVGFVAAVQGDHAIIEHYNYNEANAYSVTRTPISEVPGFIRITGAGTPGEDS